MSVQANHNTGTKARTKKPNGTLRSVLSLTEEPVEVPIPAPIALAVSTVQVGFPTPAVIACPHPFQAMGTAAQTTLMDATALIYTPNGILIGTLDANPPPPFTWSYTFTNPLPQGVPLSFVASGTTAGGGRDQTIVPFQCQ